MRNMLEILQFRDQLFTHPVPLTVKSPVGSDSSCWKDKKTKGCLSGNFFYGYAGVMETTISSPDKVKECGESNETFSLSSRQSNSLQMKSL